MIDYIKFSIRLEGDLPVIGNLLTIKRKDRDPDNSQTETKIQVKKHAPEFKAKVYHKKRLLTFWGCPLVWLQGHNGLGSNNLRGIVKTLTPILFEQLDLDYTKQISEVVNRGDYMLHEVHIAEHYRIGGQAVDKWVDTIRRFAPAELGVTSIEKGVGIRLWPNSRHRSVLIYDKVSYYEDKQHKHQTRLLGKLDEDSTTRSNFQKRFQRLLRHLQQGVRVEVRLKSPFLKRNGVTHGKDWSVAKAKELHRSVILDLPLHRRELKANALKLLSIPNAKKKGDRMRQKLLSAYCAGDSCREVCGSDASFYRWRGTMLAEFGVDISRRAVPSQFRWLDSNLDEARIKTPKWATKTGFAYLPSRARQTGLRSHYERAWLGRSRFGQAGSRLS